jgi:hypothetical protein
MRVPAPARPGRALVVLTVVVAAALVLAGCVSIPTSGPIGSGDVVVTEPGTAFPVANAPDPDAGPEQIIGGFLSAVDAGLYDEFQVARQFLTLSASSRWDPRARVVVYEGGGPEIVLQDDDTYLVTVPVKATLDQGGRYVEAPSGVREELAVELARTADDQWRISTPPDGVLISAPTFDQIYRRTPVYFASTDLTHLVPDVRWFPARYQASSAVEALLAGPSPWLRDAVLTGAPEGARLSATAVTVTRGVAQVDLTPQARQASAADRGLLQVQLEATLERLPGVLVNQVQVTVSGVASERPLTPELVRDPVPLPGPFVVIEDRLALLDAGEIVPLEDTAPLEGLEVTGLAVAPDGQARVVRDGVDRLVVLPTDGSEAVELHAGRSLVRPSVDRHGWVWTGERSSSGSLLALRPTGAAVDVTAEWLDGRVLRSLQVSRDGVRVAIVSSGADGGPVLDVAAVVRDDDGTPRLVSAPLTLGPSLTDVTQAVWVDEATVAVLGSTAAQTPPAVHLVPLGGPLSSLAPVEDTVWIAAGRGERAVYLRTETGELHLRQNQGWAVIAEDVLVAAYPG